MLDAMTTTAQDADDAWDLEHILESLRTPLSEDQLWAVADAVSRHMKDSYEASGFPLPVADRPDTLCLTLSSILLTSDGRIKLQAEHPITSNMSQSFDSLFCLTSLVPSKRGCRIPPLLLASCDGDY